MGPARRPTRPGSGACAPGGPRCRRGASSRAVGSSRACRSSGSPLVEGWADRTPSEIRHDVRRRPKEGATVNMDHVEAWMLGYVRAWTSNAPDEIGDLFTDDAEYYTAPGRKPWSGREAIVREWLGR